MKSCDGCGECCKLLEITEINKAENTPCSLLRVANDGALSCGIHEKKPSSCGAFFCLWLMSQMRPDPKERIPEHLRPDKTHVVFYRNGTEIDPNIITAHVNPEFPMAGYANSVMEEVKRLMNRGITVVMQIGDTLVFHKKGQPTVTTDAKTARTVAGRTIAWQRPNLPAGSGRPS